MYRASLVAIALVGVVQAGPMERLNKRELNGVGLTPAMGFNNWNAGLSSSAATALAAANYFISLGLKDVGYEYINTDDTWSNMSRSSTGQLVPDSNKWPNGIKAVADEIHGLGLKMGLYGDSGTATCSGFPGSQGHETTDANTLAGWGIDHWKYDNCATPSGSSIPRYQTMSAALRASGQEIYYSLCNWGADSVWEWGNTTGNSWRVGSDITDSFASVAAIAAANAPLATYAGPGGFNDFDMLEIGNGGLTPAEERTHFALWAISKSPLLIGTDLSKISAASLAVLKNKDLISINQDPLSLAATTFQPAGASPPTANTLYPYYAGRLTDGFVIALIATSSTSSSSTLSISFTDVPGLGPGPFVWRECYSGATGTGTTLSATLAPHDIAVFRVFTTAGTTTKTASTTGRTSPTTTTASTTTTTTTARTTSTASASGTSTPSAVPEYGQCGGASWTGATVCAAGSKCTYENEYYSQCL